MQVLHFQTPQEAAAVAAQLYHCEQTEEMLLLHEPDKYAWKTAVALAQVSSPIAGETYCRLPYPKEERECYDKSVPQIYVACLAAYNQGKLHGLWIDATKEPDDIREDVEWMLSWSPVAEEECCEEVEIQDYDNFDSIHISARECFENVSAIANAIAKHGEAFAPFYSYYKYSGVVAAEKFEHQFVGEYKNPKSFAWEQWEEKGIIAKVEEIGVNPTYIDFDAVVTEWETGGDYIFFEVKHNVTYVFCRDTA